MVAVVYVMQPDKGTGLLKTHVCPRGPAVLEEVKDIIIKTASSRVSGG